MKTLGNNTKILIFILFFIVRNTALQANNNSLTPGYKANTQLQNDYRVSGAVYDSISGETMVGVNIIVKENRQLGVVTDFKGNYSLMLPEGHCTLVYSFIGYETAEVPVDLSGDITLDIILKPSSNEIDEVQIISERKFFGDMDKGRTIESIDIKEIGISNSNNASDILHARLPGVWSTKVSGAPGDHQKIRIRGINSLFGSVDPLYVVNGVPVPNVNFSTLGIADLNVYDIENITVLKDASSTALYGYQGGNGVVLIDTKSGGNKELSFSATIGIQRLSHKYKLMNSTDFLNNIDSSHHIGSSIYRYYPSVNDSICNTDWQDALFRDGIMKEYQLSASGKLGKTSYYISGNYHDHEGAIENSSYKKLTLNTKFSRMFGKKLKIEGSYMGSVQNNLNNLDMYGGNPLIFEGINKSPCYNCTPEHMYYTDADEIALRVYADYPELNKMQDIGEVIKTNRHTLDIPSNSAGLFAQYRLSENLFLNTSSTLTYKKYRYETFDYLQNFSGSLNYIKSHEDYIISNQQVNLGWNKILGNHQLKFLAAYRNYADNVYWLVDSTNYDYLYSSYDGIFTRGSMAIHGPTGSVIRRINSLIGHINYNYKNKYFISAVANYDHLKEGKFVDVRELFPSIALNWDVSRDFNLSGLKKLDYLNLYINWGKVGNYPLNGLSNDLYINAQYIANNTILNGTRIFQLSNHKMRHENIEEYNYGVKAGLFGERIRISADYFTKTNSDLILLRDIPYYYGGGQMFLNIGEVQSNGIEFSFEVIPVSNKNFTWYMRFNYSVNNQKVKKLIDQDNLNFINDDILVPDFIVGINEPLGSIVGYKYLGIWTPDDDGSDDPFIAKWGELKYYQGDTTSKYFTSGDKTVIGNSLPDYTCNFYSSFEYKTFMLDFTWYAVIGVDKYNATRAGTYIAATNSELQGLVQDKISGIFSHVYYESSVFVEDAGFIRMKQVSLSYSPEKSFFNGVKMKFSLSFDNLLTFTKYKGYDPEATIYTDNNFSDNAIDRGAYPTPKSVYLTIQLTM